MAEINDVLKFDKCKMYFCRDYEVNSKITIHPPTVGGVIDFGEEKYFTTVNSICSIPSDRKSMLHDAGINYMEISDYEYFRDVICPSLPMDYTSLLFGENLDLSKSIRLKNESGDIVLYDREHDVLVDKLAYLKISGYLKELHNIKPKVEKAATKTVYDILIKMDREKWEKASKEAYQSPFYEMISAMMRYPGFKYKSSELNECGLFEFFDTVRGSQIYVSATALIQGSYSGMIDTKKIEKKEFNWMRCD